MLIVEDNVDAAMALASLLRLSGHSVEVAHDAHSALPRLRQSGAAVVLCDLGLPNGLSGHDFASLVRKDPAFDDVILIAVTAYGDERRVARSAEVGFDAHLVKPVPPSEILDRIQALLAAKRAPVN